jgi:hypothetical protein
MYWSVWRDQLEKTLGSIGSKARIEVNGCALTIYNDEHEERLYCVQYSPYRYRFDIDFSYIPLNNLPRSRQWGNDDLIGFLIKDDDVTVVVHTQQRFRLGDKAIPLCD